MRLLILLLLAPLAASCFDAHASPPLPVAQAVVASPPLAIAQALPMVGPGFLDSISVTCADSPTPITQEVLTSVHGGETAIAFACQPPEPSETAATVLVGFGDSTLPDPAYATRKGEVICGSGCNRNVWIGNIRGAYCRADTGSVKITCNALLPNASAP